jgi:hypothetical protein
MTSKITQYVRRKYGSSSERARSICDRLERLWDAHRPLANPHFVEEFCSGDEAKFVQRYWEMCLGQLLREAGWQLESVARGPDFKATRGSRVIWVEAVAPGPGSGPNRLPQEYISPLLDAGVQAYWDPTDAIMLRVTTALEAKYRKLVGYDEPNGRHKPGYLEQGTIKPDEPYLIAINTVLLGHSGGVGSSDLPAVVEAVFPVGAPSVTVNRKTRKVVHEGISFQPTLIAASGASIRTDIFLQVCYAGISAVLGHHEGPSSLPSRWFKNRLIVAHNPLAINQLTDGQFGHAREYRAKQRGTRWYLHHVVT